MVFVNVRLVWRDQR